MDDLEEDEVQEWSEYHQVANAIPGIDIDPKAKTFTIRSREEFLS